MSKHRARLSGMDTARFLDGLWQGQRQRGWTDALLARKLGVHQSTVLRLKNGEHERPGLTVALAIIREFPELAVFLTSDLRIGQSIMPICQDAEGEPQ